ncbi:hypothetical protein HJC10_40740 [Corallococcus exiguus]|uniref:hypothetical protein n=1 Tax=Corallococcus TaxID=83461 RepID=UPI000EC7F489|nr:MULTISPECIES: hypothetical protein [Corallococcus]NNB91959.1 hypothetical protein [Corallococcus exiguus]NNC00219.1 hypothetical protein [Corallococcus exiguus]NNC09138.1 hypothetical protein [Corallococcus exiguus]NPC52578.1 hypothetical protein [Corallococcus exiguus]RKH82701.1 hypothetical protein D7X99_14920 [Corallococcus sp. AB032C]
MRDGTPFDPVAVARIAVMVRTGLVGLKQLIAWADAWVMKLDEPPLWLLELCTVPGTDRAHGLLLDMPGIAQLATVEERDVEDADHLASLFLRHRDGSISWGDFLLRAGEYLDGKSGHRQCEEFYMQLNLLERMGFPEDLVQAQREDIERSLLDALERMESSHRRFEAEARGD